MTADHPAVDLGPPARQLADVVRGVADDQLTRPTPCAGVLVGDLLDHVAALAEAFRQAADRTGGPPRPGEDGAVGPPPTPSAARLPADWRTRIPGLLDQLVAAWQAPEAWDGMATAGGVTMPGAVAGRVAVDELVLHGWDLATATGQPFTCDPASTDVVFEFTSQMSLPGEEAGREKLFGPVVEVPPDASRFDRALGFSGRDPAWKP